jgi:hypothetical protein
LRVAKDVERDVMVLSKIEDGLNAFVSCEEWVLRPEEMELIEFDAIFSF